MKVYLRFPSLALQVHNKADVFLSELILWNASLDFHRYVDFRKNIELKSHTLFVFHMGPEDGTKEVAIAPVNSNTFIKTDENFYRFNVQERIKKLSPAK